ncbi:MAG: hypothetical protein B7C24_11360 [Bacteroidetes bacterium 4572_77]|nr:MAG: hypothetical protein B7C24_11360 [Bacteroidetes bacterium 4572_77]
MKSYKILLVDDAIENLKTMVSIIENNHPNYTIYQANSGHAALDLLEHTLVDIILTDWEMPKMKGLELMALLKTKPITRNIPCIIVTGVRITASNLKTAIDAGAVDYIRKPINALEMLARMNSAILIAENHKQLLQAKEAQIVENVAFTNETNHFLKSLLSKTKKLEDKTKSHPLLQKEIDLLNNNINEKLNNRNWQIQLESYQKLYPIFTKSLVRLHPSLTSTEIELCQMTRLGLKNKEIAELMFITLGSLRVSKSRLRKKMGLPTKQNLQLYLVSL